MVISASRRTDIPAFYGRWFQERLKAGECLVANPFSGKESIVSLRPEDVEAYVFWTKKPWPFFPVLDSLHESGVVFSLQFTITPYDRVIEKAVIPVERAIEAARTLAARFGPAAVVWRYDPIIITEHQTPAWHMEQFRRMARHLEGSVDEVVTKFLVPYAKTVRNLASASSLRATTGSEDAQKALLEEMNEAAADHGMALKVCSMPTMEGRLPSAMCIDPVRLRRLGAKLKTCKSNPSREGCQCLESRDIGAYDTCPQGCSYCYANQNQALAVARFRDHSPLDPSLTPRRGMDQAPLQPRLPF